MACPSRNLKRNASILRSDCGLALGAGLLTPPEGPTEGLRFRQWMRDFQKCFLSEPVVIECRRQGSARRIGDLRSCLPAGSGDPRRAREGLHVRRNLFTFASALSLMLCAASTIFWVRSYYRGDQIGWYFNEWDGGEGRFRACGFDSDSGGFVFFLNRRESHLDLNDPADAAHWIANPALSHPSWLVHDNWGYPYMTHYPGAGSFGFGYFGGDKLEPSLGIPMVCDDDFVVVPGWVPAIVAAALPVTWIICRRRRRSANLEGSLVHGDISNPRSWRVLDVVIGLTVLAIALTIALG